MHSNTQNYFFYKQVFMLVIICVCVHADCRCVHGVCDNRPGSLGACRRDSCLPGYSGELCDQAATPCDSDGAFKHCHVHAHCTYIDDQTMSVL